MTPDERELLLLVARIHAEGFRQRNNMQLKDLIAKVEADGRREADDEHANERG